MVSYDVQFDAKNVKDRFKEYRALRGKDKRYANEVAKHGLFNDIVGIHAKAGAFSSPEEDYGRLPTIHQIAYVNNLKNSGKLILKTLDNLFEFSRKIRIKIEEIEEIKMESSSYDFVYYLKELSQYLPATEPVLQLAPLSKKRKGILEDIDIFYSMSFYAFNLEFSPDFQREVYNLKEDLRHLWISQYSEPKDKNFIGMMEPDLMSFETNVDYMGNVIMPLISNIHHHAFNPENDVHGKLKNTEKPYIRYFNIYTKDNEKNKEMLVKVSDRGFGIRPEVQERLFQKGTSSKKDRETEHGIGLWAVKNFVEKNGGRIWFETELGEGTSFHFTIPYKERKKYMYKQ